MKYSLSEELFEDINNYYRYVLVKGNKEYSLFIELGKYLKKLYNKDDMIYDEFNRSLSSLEYQMKVPDLDYKNKNYSFAFTEEGINLLREYIEDLDYYIEEYSPYELALRKVRIDDKDIVYKDDIQVAWEI